MPTVDERLQQLLSDVAVEPTAEGDVFGVVTRKRHQRARRRTTRNIGAVVVLLLVFAGSLAWLTADGGTEPAVAPTRRDPVASRKLGDAWLGAQPVALTPDLGYVRGPLIQSGEYVEFATYTRDGAGFKVPSHVVRVDASGRVLDEVELQGEILSLADGDGARWVVTHDGDNVANRLYRVKRIGPDGTVLSNAFPPGVVPTGPIVAATSGAWVPVDGGVVRFAPTTGAYAETVLLPGWRLPRLLHAGPDVYAYNPVVRPGDGSGLGQIARLIANAPPTIVQTGIAPWSVAATPNGAWALVKEGSRTVIAPLDLSTGEFDRARGVELPKRFQGLELQLAGDTLWVRGPFSDNQAGIARIKVRKDGRAVVDEPVMFRAPTRSDVLGLDGHDVLVAADGELYRVDVRS